MPRPACLPGEAAVRLAQGEVGAGFDAARDQRASGSAEGWLLSPGHGSLFHGGKGSDWAGQAAAGQLKVGDVVVRSHRPSDLPAAGG